MKKVTTSSLVIAVLSLPATASAGEPHGFADAAAFDNSEHSNVGDEYRNTLERAFHELGSKVGQWVAAGDPVGAEILVTYKGDAVFHESYGWSDREQARPLQRNSVYRLRSMTKPLVGTAILLLVEDGKLALDDRVSEYLPSFDNDRSRLVTIRELITHTSGFGDHGTQDIGLSTRPDEHGSLRALVDEIGDIGPAGPPGEFLYSDSGSSTLGALVAEVSGLSAEEFIEARILDPLGMDRTYSVFSPDVDWADQMNSTYRLSPEKCGVEKYWDPSMPQRFAYFRASGGLYSTTLDYDRFLNLWTNRGVAGEKRLLSQTLVEQALRPASERPSGQQYGMHWTIFAEGAGNDLAGTFGHGGSDGTVALAFPEIHTNVLFFTQTRRSIAREKFLQEIALIQPFSSYMDAKPIYIELSEAEQLATEVSIGSDDVDPVPTGVYSNGRLEHRVAIENGRLLYFIESDSNPAPLKHVSGNTFIGKHPCVGFLFRLIFDTSKDGYRLEASSGFSTEFVRMKGAEIP